MPEIKAEVKFTILHGMVKEDISTIISRVILAGRSFSILIRPVVKISLRLLFVLLSKNKEHNIMREQKQMIIAFIVRRSTKFDEIR